MVSPEPTGSTIARPEHPNAGKAEIKDLKNNFMMIVKTFKEEMEISPTEIEEKTNKT